MTTLPDRLQADVRAALRQLLAGVVQASVVASPIGATGGTAGGSGGSGAYTRTTGSFLTDGFVPGAEVTATGFVAAANNGVSQILSVSDLALTVRAPTPLTAEAPGAAAALTVALPTQRAWEGYVVDPDAGAPYVRDTLLRAPESSQRVSIGIGARRRHRGLYQLSLCYPLGMGPDAAEAMADAIRQAAEASETLVSHGRTIILTNPSIATGGPDGAWYHVPVSLSYYVDTLS